MLISSEEILPLPLGVVGSPRHPPLIRAVRTQVLLYCPKTSMTEAAAGISARGRGVPGGLLEMSGDAFGCHNWYVSGSKWVEAKHAVNYLTGHCHREDLPLLSTVLW